MKEGETAHSLSRGELNLPVRTCLICGRPAGTPSQDFRSEWRY
ncbi:hypothetical protein QPX96_01525 [Limosilactobacillus fermentum]|nr:hypothetical protein [Limosilactobacillus fermentum]